MRRAGRAVRSCLDDAADPGCDAAGSIHGGARIRVTVEDITIGAVLRFGSTVVGTFRSDGVFVVPSGTAGSVEVVVDNLNGHTAVLPGGFRYVDPGVFDANGTWQGRAFDFLSDTDVDVDFTVEGSVLTRFLCSGKAAFTPDVAIPIANGAFSYASGDEMKLSGRLVAEGQVSGTADLPGCPGVFWSASRR